MRCQWARALVASMCCRNADQAVTADSTSTVELLAGAQNPGQIGVGMVYAPSRHLERFRADIQIFWQRLPSGSSVLDNLGSVSLRSDLPCDTQ